MYRIGQSYDLHRLQPGHEIRLGGVIIPAEVQVEAHSDGDVLLHVISEAILGALGRGDLGDHFPPTGPSRSSEQILQTVLGWMRDDGMTITNLDTLVVLDRPKLLVYKTAIKNRLATLLGIDATLINMKATTTEQTNPQVIQAHCVVLLVTNH